MTVARFRIGRRYTSRANPIWRALEHNPHCVLSIVDDYDDHKPTTLQDSIAHQLIRRDGPRDRATATQALRRMRQRPEP